MASSFKASRKRPRTTLTDTMKKELCLFKQSHPEFTYDELQVHFISRWDIRIGSSTIGNVKMREKWLATDDSDKPKRVALPKHHSLEDSLSLYGLAGFVLKEWRSAT